MSTAKIWWSTTNQFKQGGSDRYRLMLAIKLSKGIATTDVSNILSSFNKVMIATLENKLNCLMI